MFKKEGQKKFLFQWEGVRRCAPWAYLHDVRPGPKVNELTKRSFKVIGVIYENWKAYDGDEWFEGIPQDTDVQLKEMEV